MTHQELIEQSQNQQTLTMFILFIFTYIMISIIINHYVDNKQETKQTKRSYKYFKKYHLFN